MKSYELLYFAKNIWKNIGKNISKNLSSKCTADVLKTSWKKQFKMQQKEQAIWLLNKLITDKIIKISKSSPQNNLEIVDGEASMNK